MGVKILRLEDIFPAFKRFNGFAYVCCAKHLPIRRYQTYRAFCLLRDSYRKRGFSYE